MFLTCGHVPQGKLADWKSCYAFNNANLGAGFLYHYNNGLFLYHYNNGLFIFWFISTKNYVDFVFNAMHMKRLDFHTSTKYVYNLSPSWLGFNALFFNFHPTGKVYKRPKV